MCYNGVEKKIRRYWYTEQKRRYILTTLSLSGLLTSTKRRIFRTAELLKRHYLNITKMKLKNLGKARRKNSNEKNYSSGGRY